MDRANAATPTASSSQGRRRFSPAQRCAFGLLVVLALAVLLVVWKRSGRARSPQTLHPAAPSMALRSGLDAQQHLTVALDSQDLGQALRLYGALTGRQLLSPTNTVAERVDDLLNGQLSRWRLVSASPEDATSSELTFHHDGMYTAGHLKETLEEIFRTNGLKLVAVGQRYFRVGTAP